MIIKEIPIESVNRLTGELNLHTNTKLAGVDLSRLMQPDMLEFWNKLPNIDTSKWGYVLVNILGAGEYYGCFPPGTMVNLRDGGQLPIEDVAEEDYILNHIGLGDKVINTTVRNYAGKMYHFILNSSGSNVVCTEEHPILTTSKEGVAGNRRLAYKQKEAGILKYDFKPANELGLGDFVCVPYPTAIEHSKELDGLAFLLGTYLAEGCISIRRDRGDPYESRVIYTLNNNDEYTINKIIEECAAIGHKAEVLRMYQEKNVARITLHSKELAILCSSEMGRGARHKFISEKILKMPKEWLSEFLSAYINGDGRIVKTGKDRYRGTITSSTASPKLTMDLCRLSAKLGYKASSYQDAQRGGFGHGNEIYVNTYEKGIYNILNIPRFGNVSAKTRPSTIMTYIDGANGYILFPISEIYTTDYDGPVYNLTVSNSNSYCVNGFAVHNCNLNGDYFSEKALQKYHKTFHHAHVYLNHDNNDTDKAIGKVIFAVYNPVMHRVEILVQISKELQRGRDILDRIDAGDYPVWSMGCKVPFDTCSKCKNRASSRKDYCPHLKNEMNTMDPDGDMVYAENDDPDFFDASVVHIEADRSSGTLGKVAASKEAEMDKDELIDKHPKELTQAVEESSELRSKGKKIDSGDEDLPKEDLRKITDGKSINDVLGTMGGMRMKVRPREMMYIVINKRNGPEMADAMYDKGVGISPIFDHVVDSMPSLFNFGSNFDDGIAEKLLPMLHERSMFPRHANHRVIIIKQGSASPLTLVNDTAARRLYGRYIKDLMEAPITDLDSALKKHAWLIPYLNNNLDNVLFKGASVDCSIRDQLESLAMLYGAYLD
jgi:hypothetical protein